VLNPAEELASLEAGAVTPIVCRWIEEDLCSACFEPTLVGPPAILEDEPWRRKLLRGDL
jgi:hypothetical protein